MVSINIHILLTINQTNGRRNGFLHIKPSHGTCDNLPAEATVHENPLDLSDTSFTIYIVIPMHAKPFDLGRLRTNNVGITIINHPPKIGSITHQIVDLLLLYPHYCIYLGKLICFAGAKPLDLHLS